MFNMVLSKNAQGSSVKNVLTVLAERGYEVNKGWEMMPRSLNINFRNAVNPTGYHVLNTPRAILRASDKEAFRMEAMAKLPNYACTTYQLRRGYPPANAYPLVIRPQTHQQGKEFYLVESERELRQLLATRPYLSQAIEVIFPNREFRVFCGRNFQGESTCWKIVEKRPTFELTGDFREDLKPKNHHQGNASFRLVKDFDDTHRVISVALAGMDMIGLDFGAVDIIYHTQKNHPYLLEINTRFALEVDTTIAAFADYLEQYYIDWQENK